MVLRRRGPSILALSLLAALVSGPSTATGQNRRGGSLLLGAGPVARRTPLARDPWLPTGAERFVLHRPQPGSEPPACSFERPVCVHRASGVTGEQAMIALGALERAYERLVLSLRLPPPLGDLGRGGSDSLDLYLRPAPQLELYVGHDEFEIDFWDRASAFCLLDAPTGAALDRAATQCVAEAVALRLDASESPHTRRAFASHLWLVTGRPESADLDAIDELQSHPELGIAASTSSRLSEGAALFFDYLDQTLSQSMPGWLATALIALSSGKTAPQASHWDNDPDVFEVLRRSLSDDSARMAKLLADFAVTRAFVGDRDDASHLPSRLWTGAAGRARFDWVLTYSSLPRRVAAARPIDPTGSTYVWLELDRLPEAATLGFRAEWEAPVEFAWTLVRVARDGTELSRFMVPYRQRATSVEHALENLQGAAAVLVAGINLGGVGADHPLDPDVTPFEGHSCTVYLAAL